MADGRRLTRLEAEALGDHVIHATAAYIQSRGVRIDRELVERPGRFGSVAKFAEYRLAPDQIPAARRLLEGADGE